MPQAVAAYVAGASYQRIEVVKRNILSLYEDDLEKYDEEEGARASAVFRSIPSQLSHHNARFRYAGVGGRARASNVVRQGSGRPTPYEVDFLVVRGRRVCPVEVKSSGYRRHASLDQFVDKYGVGGAESYVLTPKDLTREGNLTYAPLYMAMCL